MIKSSILIADDDESVLKAIRLHLKSEGYQCVCVQSPDEVLAELKAKEFALLLMDLNYNLDTTSGQEGLELIDAVRQIDEYIPIVAMTGWGTIDIAVDAMRRGANDFLEKPCDNNRLLTTVQNLVALGRQNKQSQLLVNENKLLRSKNWPEHWICQSRAMRAVMDMVERVAASDINVLITGENGTGKSQLAELIHQASNRNQHALVNVNMGAINEQVFESELFGHVKGAFTDAKANRLGRIELAHEGSLFMDEVANIPLSQQAKLLRVLESGNFEKLGSSRSQSADVRVISATNGNLEQMVESGEFRKDLMYRLNSFEIKLPSLKDRTDDIIPLAEQALKRYSDKYKQSGLTLSSSAEEALLNYTWPGNVRELNHLIERAILMCKNGIIEANDLMLPDNKQTSPQVSEGNDDWANLTMEQAEKKLIGMAMRRFQGNAKDAAAALGYSKSAFYRRLEKFGL